VKLVDISGTKEGTSESKIEELETNSKLKNIRDLYRSNSDFKKGYQTESNIARDEKGDLVTNSHIILGTWWNHFIQLFNLHGVYDVMQREIHTAELLVPAPSAFEVEMTIEKLRKHKSPGTDQIVEELIKAGGRIIYSEIHTYLLTPWSGIFLDKLTIFFYIVPIGFWFMLMMLVHWAEA
jgi:hypothetical protein